MHLKVQCAILVSVGILLIIVGSVLKSSFGGLFNSKLEKKLMVPGPIFMQFWLFNVTNEGEVLKGAMPVLDQVGPYTYEEKQLKYNLTFDHEEGTITYLQNKTFFYRPDLSPGVDLEDKVTTVNAAAMTLVPRLASKPMPIRAAIKESYKRKGVKPFVTKSVRELLFDGYDEILMTHLFQFSNNPEYDTNYFGFYRKNNTNFGSYKVYTGEEGMDNYQHIARWRGEEMIDFWEPDLYGGNSCNMMNGTAGNQFPRPVERHGILRLYVSELCRSIYAEYQKDVQHGALTLYRHVWKKEAFEKTDEDECFCTAEFTCRSSMIDAAPCTKGIPFVMSAPHFYQGSPEDISQLGLHPVAEEHQSYLDIEPNTGVTFRAAKRIQTNMPMKKYGGLPAFKNIPSVILPVFWVNESAVVPIERVQDLPSWHTFPFVLVLVFMALLITVGVVLITVAVVKMCLARGASNRRPWKDRDDNVLMRLTPRSRC